MKIRVFRPQEYKIGTERYEELIGHGGWLPSKEEIHLFYRETLPLVIDVRFGDIIEIAGQRYFYAPSGLLLYPAMA